jgi:hypothetical protein
MLAFSFIGNDEAGWERRQDQIGLGAEAAAGDASCGRFDPGSQLRAAALRAWRVGASPPVIALESMAAGMA